MRNYKIENGIMIVKYGCEKIKFELPKTLSDYIDKVKTMGKVYDTKSLFQNEIISCKYRLEVEDIESGAKEVIKTSKKCNCCWSISCHEPIITIMIELGKIDRWEGSKQHYLFNTVVLTIPVEKLANNKGHVTVL